jgi:hypothetical protein
MELVGKGFDAGDLRLGRATPQETLVVDLTRETLIKRVRIAQNAYEQERRTRSEMIRKLKAYTEFANKSGRLLASLSAFAVASTQTEPTIPHRYTALTREQIHELIRLTRILQSSVIPKLPPSDVYVASLSRIRDKRWVVWDVYGSWYKR